MKREESGGMACVVASESPDIMDAALFALEALSLVRSLVDGNAANNSATVSSSILQIVQRGARVVCGSVARGAPRDLLPALLPVMRGMEGLNPIPALVRAFGREASEELVDATASTSSDLLGAMLDVVWSGLMAMPTETPDDAARLEEGVAHWAHLVLRHRRAMSREDAERCIERACHAATTMTPAAMSGSMLDLFVEEMSAAR